ncbi:hypothetical protein C8F04DRAFT_1197069 [Mycena alexandri]|uniref:Uncharacterized protein n=1 Tax=Mycena alexandri TaxID=1745969 RepID=A0AAD6S550_9AGAR|nr:hypothetical protein C8F04DRAFT_1197069 [Mycena alexandri]
MPPRRRLTLPPTSGPRFASFAANLCCPQRISPSHHASAVFASSLGLIAWRGGTLQCLAITIETLRLLFHFTNLTSVELRPPTGIDVTDEDVLAMAEAWPHLEDLLLRTRPTDHPPRATLHSLLHLAKHCAKLATLELIVDASTIPTIECNEDKTRLLQSALLDWTVGHSLISSPIEVARFLSGIFPILNGTWSSEDYDDDGSDTEMQSYWGEVCHSTWERLLYAAPSIRSVLCRIPNFSSLIGPPEFFFAIRSKKNQLQIQ